ncbi:MAG: 2Fe-2S iron-sulfur cluster-binding protein [Desulfoferrobacter sp.]
MKDVTLKIDGSDVTVAEGATLLEAAKSIGIQIPTLCYHQDVESAGVCRFCMVEVKKGNRTRLVASCVYPAEQGIEVQTDSEKINSVRKMILELLLPVAASGPIKALAKKYGIEKSRFEVAEEEQTHCTLCGICVRYCDQVTQEHVAGFVGRGVKRKVALMAEKGDQCVFCQKCYDLCHGGRFIEIAEGFPEVL